MAEGPVTFTPTSARRIGRAVRTVERTVADRSNQPRERRNVPPRETIIARLTTGPTDGQYGWVEVYRKQDGTYATQAGGRTSNTGGTNAQRAFAGNAATTFTTGETTGEVVTLRRAPVRQTDGTHKPGWLIVSGGGIPAPTAKYQVFTPIDDTLKPIWTTARFM